MTEGVDEGDETDRSGADRVENEWAADTYDDQLSAVFDLSQDLVDLLDPEPGECVADLGCGTGHLTAAVAERGPNVVGVDRSPEMVARAREQHPGVQFVRGDGTALPFDAELDAVFSNAALHWIDDQDALLASIRDALRPPGDDVGGSDGDAGESDGRSDGVGGRLVAELGGTGNVAAITDAVAAELEARGYDGTHPWYFPSPGEYASRLEAHGFEVRLTRLFDRPTPIEGGEDGLATWLDVFGDGLFGPLSGAERAEVVAAVEDRLRDELFDGQQWVGDYRRLRVVAVRT